MQKKLFFLFFYSLYHVITFASNEKNILISGRVNTDDGEAVIAKIVLKNSMHGTLSDHEGRYALSLPHGKQTLIISALGYLPQEHTLQISSDNRTFDFTLRSDRTLLKEVTVVSKSKSRKEREQGFALSSVNTQKNALRNSSTAELLNKAAGIKLRESGGAGSEIKYNINGLSGNSIRIFIDGIPIQSYGTSFSVASIPPSLIERIDVYKGVIPPHLADDALGGAINIILKQPVYQNISTAYSYGSFNTHKWDFNGSYHHSKTGFTVQGSSFFNHSDNDYPVWGDAVKTTDPQTGKVEQIKARRFHDTYQSKGFTLQTGFTQVKWADRFLLGLVYSDMNKDIQHGATMEVVYGNRKSLQHTYLGKLLYEKKNLIKNLDFTTTVTYASGKRTVVDTIPFMYDWSGNILTDRNGKPILWNKGGGEAGKATLGTNLEKTFTTRTQITYMFLPKQNLSAGMLYHRFSRDIEDPFLSEAEQQFMDTRIVNKTLFSLSWNGTELNEKMQHSLFYKYYHQGVSLTDPIVENGIIRGKRTERSIPAHGWGGTLSYRIHSKVLLTTSAEYATRLPGVTELLGNTTDNVEPTYGLQPEKSINLNIGALLGPFRKNRHEFEGDVNLFFRDTRDMIQKSLTNQTDEMYGYENLGKIRSKGFDLDLRYHYDHRLSSHFRLSYSDARFNLRYDSHGTEYLYYGNRLRNDPFFTFNWDVEYIGLNWLQRGSRTSLAYNMNYVHQFYRNWESLGGAGKAIIPSQLTHDISLLYTFPKKQFSIGIDCKNLLNEQLFDNWALQKPGRSFAAKVSYNFAK